MFQRRRALTQVQAVAIAVIVIIAGVGIYYLSSKLGASSSTNPNPSPSPLPSPSPTPSPSPSPSPSPTPTPTPTHSVTPLPTALPPGTTKTQTFISGGYNRTYQLHISKIYDENKQTPLVIALHGFSESMFIADKIISKDQSDSEGFIVVYPQGYFRGSPNRASWHAKGQYGDAYLYNIDDVGFIRELIYRISQRYNVDPDRIYVAGFSNGASMTYRLGSELSDVVAAIAPVSGTVGGYWNATSQLEVCTEPKQPMPAIIFSGTAESQYSGNIVEGLGENRIYSLSASVAMWVNFEGCNKTPQNTTITDGTIIKSVYSGGKSGAEVVFYTIVGGIHAVPTGAPGLMWDFFKSHPKQH
jgi:polyhydroxybutyrate depolymerase